ncbi:MAG: hypothetical protein M0Q51_04190 [Bacteroidales bacterium]|nr:hypothetical protein [Bacteroidales bacterium]
MNTLEILIEAIKNRQPISFEYNKEGKVEGTRFGKPYAVFIYIAKNTRIQSTKVHIVQTGGVSDTREENQFESFRMFNIEDLSNVKILEDEKVFGPPFHENYNPEWEGYRDVIAKI